MGAGAEAGIADRDGWRPEPAGYPPVFVWPPRPLAALRWLPNLVAPYNALFLVVAAGSWWLATPPVETLSSLQPGWAVAVLARNAALVVSFYGLAQWWLYRRRGQGRHWKFNRRWPTGRRSGRLLGSQIRENVLLTLVSGVPILTAIEVITLWLLASGRASWLAFDDNPIGFVALFPALVLFRELHFYVVHRAIHWPPLYRSVHSLHHRNTNPGPWSGLSMHPVEHALYGSALLVHLVVPSHPLHVLATAASLYLAPIPGHCGFERIRIGGGSVVTNGYAHYLHHKLFEVNYADGVLPLDRWFGSFHDGSPEADRRLRDRRVP